MVANYGSGYTISRQVFLPAGRGTRNAPPIKLNSMGWMELDDTDIDFSAHGLDASLIAGKKLFVPMYWHMLLPGSNRIITDSYDDVLGLIEEDINTVTVWGGESRFITDPIPISDTVRLKIRFETMPTTSDQINISITDIEGENTVFFVNPKSFTWVEDTSNPNDTHLTVVGNAVLELNVLLREGSFLIRTSSTNPVFDGLTHAITVFVRNHRIITFTQTEEQGTVEGQAFASNGYYPLYTTIDAAKSQSTNGIVEVLNNDSNVTYYMPNQGVTKYYGNYTPQLEESGGGTTDNGGSGSGDNTVIQDVSETPNLE